MWPLCTQFLETALKQSLCLYVSVCLSRYGEDMGRMNCMRRWRIHANNIVSSLPYPNPFTLGFFWQMMERTRLTRDSTTKKTLAWCVWLYMLYKSWYKSHDFKTLACICIWCMWLYVLYKSWYKSHDFQFSSQSKKGRLGTRDKNFISFKTCWIRGQRGQYHAVSWLCCWECILHLLIQFILPISDLQSLGNL